MSDFDLRDSGGLVSNEQIDAEKKDARRKPATPAEPLPPPGIEHFTPEQARAWLAEYEEGKGNGAAPPDSGPFDPDNPPPGCTVYTADEVESWRRNRAGPKGPPLPPKERPTITVTPGNLPAIVDQAEDALIKANTDVYQRGTTIVRPAMVPIKISGGRETTAQQLVTLRCRNGPPRGIGGRGGCPPE
jgi:hypothetical protein